MDICTWEGIPVSVYKWFVFHSLGGSCLSRNVTKILRARESHAELGESYRDCYVITITISFSTFLPHTTLLIYYFSHGHWPAEWSGDSLAAECVPARRLIVRPLNGRYLSPFQRAPLYERQFFESARRISYCSHERAIHPSILAVYSSSLYRHRSPKRSNKPMPPAGVAALASQKLEERSLAGLIILIGNSE